MSRKHNHYFKDVRHLNDIDVYRVLSLFNVTDQAIGHAIKKLLVAGGRGHKDIYKDIQEAIDTLERWKEIQLENTPELSIQVGQEIPLVGSIKAQGKFESMFKELFNSMGLKKSCSIPEVCNGQDLCAKPSECDGKSK